MAPIAVSYVERIARRLSVRRPLGEGVSGLKVEGDLSLLRVEDITQHGSSELIVGVVAVTAAIQEINSIARLA